MSLLNEAIRILNEGATCQINFNYGRLRVNSSSFQSVQSALRRGRVTISSERPSPGTGTSGRYHRPSHTLYLWEGANAAAIRSDPASKSLIVHECVHIAVQLQYGDGIDLVDDEVAAFLAQTMYRLALQGYAYRGSRERDGAFSRSVRQHASSPSGRIFAAAQQIALGHRMLDRSTCTALFPNDVRPLRQAIQQHSAY